MRVLRTTLLSTALACSAAFAAPPASAPPLAVEEAVVMNVVGALSFQPDGKVRDLEIKTELLPELRSAVERTIRRWEFQPVVVGGHPRPARTGFRLQLVGTPEGKTYRVRVDGVDFILPEGTDKSIAAQAEATQIRGDKLVPPVYPRDAQMFGASGVVVLAIRVTPEGRTADVTVVRSMLLDIGRFDEKSARRHLLSLEKASIAAARRWSYKLPADAATRNAEGMTVMAPVEYKLFDVDTAVTGKWLPVHRLPTRPAPWLPKTQAAASDALGGTPGAVASLGGAIQLRDPASGDVVM